MATYADLYIAAGDGAQAALRKQIVVALSIKANLIAKLATVTPAQKTWAIDALKNPVNYLPMLLNYILAEYNTATIAVISAATDAQVQTAVNAAVDTLLGV